MEAPFLMTPVEFEIAVRQFLQKEGRTLKDFRVQHLEKIQGYDGDYIIDVTARFEALGADFLVLIECKRYTTDPVEREEVQALNQKKISVGAHKAMLFTTSTFRSGAIEFAKANRIALIQVSAERISYAVKTWLPEIKAEFVTPESTSLADFLFDGNILDEPEGDSPSEAATIKVFTITVLSQRLDYLRILSARGYEVDQFEIENLRKEIEAEEEELRRIRESAAYQPYQPDPRIEFLTVSLRLLARPVMRSVMPLVRTMNPNSRFGEVKGIGAVAWVFSTYPILLVLSLYITWA